MDITSVRRYCLSFPHVTSDVQWDNDLLFRIGGKIFAVACLDMSVPHRISFKCTPEKFSELIEIDGIIPAPYMARNHWVTLQRFDALPEAEIEALLMDSYTLVYDKLPKKLTSRLLEKKSQSRKHGPPVNKGLQ